MSEGLLTILKFCFLGLLFLFLIRVVRVVALELRAAPLTPVESAPAAGKRTQRRAERSRGREPTLQVLEPAERRGQTFTLDSELTVGRAGGCGIVLAGDSYASQLHARVFRRDDETYVEDLGSTNGTFVNGTRITTPTRIRRGDRVQFGRAIVELNR